MSRETRNCCFYRTVKRETFQFSVASGSNYENSATSRFPISETIIISPEFDEFLQAHDSDEWILKLLFSDILALYLNWPKINSRLKRGNRTTRHFRKHMFARDLALNGIPISLDPWSVLLRQEVEFIARENWSPDDYYPDKKAEQKLIHELGQFLPKKAKIEFGIPAYTKHSRFSTFFQIRKRSAAGISFSEVNFGTLLWYFNA